jgi:hypothetical protein
VVALANLALAIVVLAGCSIGASPAPPTIPPTLTVDNRGGPTLSIRVNGEEVVQLACGQTREIAPGIDGIPSLPWTVTVARLSDDSLLETESIADLPEYFVQNSDATLPFLEEPDPRAVPDLLSWRAGRGSERGLRS